MSVPKTWADSKGYIDGGQNIVTSKGVVGAIYNNSGGDGGSAVYGSAIDGSGNSFAGFFQNYSTSGVAVAGAALAKAGTTIGGSFVSFSSEGQAVRGLSFASTGYTYGGWFRDTSATGTAVHGEATATSDRVTYGGHFESASTKGVGVYGLATSKTGKTYGGHFLSDSSQGGTAVYGAARALQGETYGGHFLTYSSRGKAVFGSARKNKAGYSGVGGKFVSEGQDGTGVYGEISGTTGVGVFGLATNPAGVNYGVMGASQSPNGYGVYSDGNMKVAGSLDCTGSQIVGKNLLVKGNHTVTGTKSAVVKLKNGDGVALYAVEASENWFEDFGSAKLKDGAAVVAIDPLYSETVNTEIDYHVFLTPRGECKGLYVTNQKGSSFEVRELNGGESDIPFSYRIVAKRKGYEDVRLAKVKEEMLTAMTTVEEDVKNVGKK